MSNLTWSVHVNTDEPNHKVTVRTGDVHTGTGLRCVELCEVNPFLRDKDEVAALIAAAPELIELLRDIMKNGFNVSSYKAAEKLIGELKYGTKR